LGLNPGWHQLLLVNISQLPQKHDQSFLTYVDFFLEFKQAVEFNDGKVVMINLFMLYVDNV
jgi:hypothetical protein